MNSILAFRRLRPEDRRLVLRCWRLLILAALGVRLRSVKSLVHGIDERVARVARRADPPAGDPEAALRLCAAVARRVWPRPSCLVTALAGYELLRERGWSTELVIGGHKAGGAFQAHAWLEREGVVVLGASVDAYRPIWRWPATAGTARLATDESAIETRTAYR